jgi:hypothetical protein
MRLSIQVREQKQKGPPLRAAVSPKLERNKLLMG